MARLNHQPRLNNPDTILDAYYSGWTVESLSRRLKVSEPAIRTLLDDYNAIEPNPNPKPKCSTGCGSETYTMGMCRKCYGRAASRKLLARNRMEVLIAHQGASEARIEGMRELRLRMYGNVDDQVGVVREIQLEKTQLGDIKREIQELERSEATG